MHASLIRTGCGGIVPLTDDPVVLVETGLIYMLSVYHMGSVACHLLAFPFPNTSSPLHQNQQSENQSVTQEDTHAHKYTLRLLERPNDRGKGRKKEREGVTVEVKG